MMAVVACSSDAASPGRTGVATSSVPRTDVRAPSASVPTSTGSSGPGVSAGVPGLDDPDALCRGWSGVQAAIYVLQIASGFGELGAVELARLELVAAPAILDDADLVSAGWPAELVGERDVAIAAYVGPLAVRARAGVAALTAEGADITRLAASWRGALGSFDPDDGPVISPSVDPDDRPALDRAVPAFRAAVIALPDDRSLDIDPGAAASVPATLRYLDDHCADLSAVGLGDSA